LLECYYLVDYLHCTEPWHFDLVFSVAAPSTIFHHVQPLPHPNRSIRGCHNPECRNSHGSIWKDPDPTPPIRDVLRVNLR
jgi:hypothetical protein